MSEEPRERGAPRAALGGISSLGSVAVRVASLARAAMPDHVYVAVRPRLERALGLQEPELANLMRKNRGRWGRRFIDVGANWGSYSVLLGPRFDRVDAFEPIARRAAALQYYASSSGFAIDVHACALSDRNAGVPFLAPENEIVDLSGRARVVEPAHPAAITIGARTLDSFSFHDIDFVRIAVDGHERSVIAGASETLRRCRPTLLVEMEQRHFDEPLHDRIEFIERFGYRASFLREGRTCEPTELLVTRDQHAANFGKRGYINNFLFEPA